MDEEVIEEQKKAYKQHLPSLTGRFRSLTMDDAALRQRAHRQNTNPSKYGPIGRFTNVARDSLVYLCLKAMVLNMMAELKDGNLLEAKDIERQLQGMGFFAAPLYWDQVDPWHQFEKINWRRFVNKM